MSGASRPDGSGLAGRRGLPQGPYLRRRPVQRGFYAVSSREKSGTELLNANGELYVGMKEGVQYVLRFGDSVAGTSSESDGQNRYLLVTARVDMSKFPRRNWKRCRNCPPRRKPPNRQRENGRSQAGGSQARSGQTAAAKPDAKPADAKVEVKPSDTKPADPKPADAKPAEVKASPSATRTPSRTPKADPPKADAKPMPNRPPSRPR